MGAALIVEGVFGFVRGSRSARSLVNSAVLGVGAVIFIVVGNFMAPDPYAEGEYATGYISDIKEGRARRRPLLSRRF